MRLSSKPEAPLWEAGPWLLISPVLAWGLLGLACVDLDPMAPEVLASAASAGLAGVAGALLAGRALPPPRRYAADPAPKGRTVALLAAGASVAVVPVALGIWVVYLVFRNWSGSLF